MKIAQETPSLLVLKQKKIFSIILGVIFVAVGIYGFFFSKSTGGNSFIVSLALFIFGLLAVVLTRFQTITIDKTLNKISFISKGLLGGKSTRNRFK